MDDRLGRVKSSLEKLEKMDNRLERVENSLEKILEKMEEGTSSSRARAKEEEDGSDNEEFKVRPSDL